jgi:hypothetical protein
MRLSVSIALLCALAGCTEPADPAANLDLHRLPTTVTLSLGQTVEVAGTVVGFEGVNSDSRCASDLICVWAGNAEVRITIGPAVGEGPTYLVTLNTTLEPRNSDEVHGLVVTLVNLLPNPVSTETTRHYRAVIRIESAP